MSAKFLHKLRKEMGIEGGEKADKEVDQDQEAFRKERATCKVAAMARRDRDAIGTGPGAPKRPAPGNEAAGMQTRPAGAARAQQRPAGAQSKPGALTKTGMTTNKAPAPTTPSTLDLLHKEFTVALVPTKTNFQGGKLGGGAAARKKNANYNFHGDFPRGGKRAQMEISGGNERNRYLTNASSDCFLVQRF